METLNQSLGRRLRKIRDDRDLSREQVCKSTGLSATSLVDIEKGKQWPSPDTLERLSKFYGVSPAVFFTDDVVRIPPTPSEVLDIVAEALLAHRAPPTPAVDPYAELDPKKRELIRLVAECEDMSAIDEILHFNRADLESVTQAPKKRETS